jgi:hypothetical protein
MRVNIILALVPQSLVSADAADGGVNGLTDPSLGSPLVACPGLLHRHPPLQEDVFVLDLGQFVGGHEPGYRSAAKHNLDRMAHRTRLPDEFRHAEVFGYVDDIRWHDPNSPIPPRSCEKR